MDGRRGMMEVIEKKKKEKKKKIKDKDKIKENKKKRNMFFFSCFFCVKSRSLWVFYREENKMVSMGVGIFLVYNQCFKNRIDD